MKKFEFTGETKTLLDGTVLHRIKALVCIKSNTGNVEVGDIGGWVEKEDNLSHDGNAWVYGDAEVYGNARVFSDAKVCNDAKVYGNALVYDNAWICGNAEVYDDARIHGDAKVCGNVKVLGKARVYANAWVYDNARVFGNADVYGDTWIYDNARVYGNARIYGDSRVCGNAEVCGNARFYGNARVYGDAEVYKMEHYLVMGPIGSRNAFTTFFRTKERNIKVVCGCFFGTIDEFLAKVKQTHGDSKHAKVYRAAVEVALAQLEDVERRNNYR